MQNGLLSPASLPSPARSKQPADVAKSVFFCPEETHFYSQCLEKMVLSTEAIAPNIVEFGAGDGSAVINSLLKSPFNGTIQGYELSPTACQIARAHIHHHDLGDRYIIHNQCFFEGLTQTPADCLIANPPYIPAPDDRIRMPSLHGGWDGATITKRLLTMGCNQVLLMISAYSNPVETIHHARAQGYRVVDFMVTPLPFGTYSSEPKVQQWLAQLRSQQKAFYSANIYFLTGVLFQKHPYTQIDLSDELLKVMTAL
jgi:methylase of polypeptide subunit release factors